MICDSLCRGGQGWGFTYRNELLAMQVLEDALNDTIKGALDKSASGIIYTEAYVNR